MTDDKKVVRPSEFTGRREKKDGIPEAIQAQPVPGGDQGTFQRPPCGTCIHWKKITVNVTGDGFGTCMMMPPNAFAQHDAQMRIIGIANARPGMSAKDEGCDQHEDEDGNGVFAEEPDDEDDDGGGVPLASVGG